MRDIEHRRTIIALAALVVGSVAMAASPVFVRLTDVGPQASAFWRTALALPFLWIWTRFETRAGSPFARPVLLSGFFFAGDLFFWHLAILGTTVANATFLATTSPVYVALGAWLLLSESFGARWLAGLALCFVGGFALIGDSYSFAPHRLLGDAFGLVTAFFFGAYLLTMRAGRAFMGPARLTFFSTLYSTVLLFGVAVAMEPIIWPQSWSGLSAVLALALVSQVAGHGLLVIALGTLPATFSSLVIFLEGVAAAIFGWVVFGEALSLVQALGGALILAGIAVASPRSRKPAGGA